MPYLASQLITNAYYISGVVSRNLETVDGQQMNDGLSYLNSILAFKSVDLKMIPYFSEYQTTLTAGTEMYFVPNLLEVETVTFNIADLRYQMQPTSRRKYFGAGRVDNISSLPFQWHMERTLNGANIFIYFLPQGNYVMKIWGKFGLDSVASLFTDLAQTYDLFYIEYLKFALAEYICLENLIEMQPQAKAKLQEYIYKLIDVSPIDLTVSKISTLSNKPGLNWGDVNLGLGWRPG